MLNVQHLLDDMGIQYDRYQAVGGTHTGYNIELDNGWITIRQGAIVDLSYINLRKNESRHHSVEDLDELKSYIKLYAQ